MRLQPYRAIQWAICAMAVGVLAANVVWAADEKQHVFENAMRAFEAADAKTPPPEHPVLFVGSSSIRMWKLDESFPNLRVLNRGFGGSRIEDSVYYFDRVVGKYKPRVIVFYAGDNDLAEGEMTPEAVFADFKAFVANVHAELPGTPVVYISIKPSIDRWHLIESIRKTNEMIRKFCESDPLITFVDVEPAMLGADGQPRKELFIKDGLHLSAEGYKVWTELVTPHLK